MCLAMLLRRVFLAWLTLVQPAGRAAQAARERQERLERLEQESAAARRSTQQRDITAAAPQASAASISPALPADSGSSMPTALRAATVAPEAAPVASPVSVTGPAAAPMPSPSAPVSATAAAASAAAAGEDARPAPTPAGAEAPDLGSLPSLRPIIVGPSTVEAAGSPVPGGSDHGSSSPPVEEVHFANRRRSTLDTDNGAGAMVAQPPPGPLGQHPAAYMWQQWHSMMQTERANSFGGAAGAIPLPFGAWGQLAASVQAAAEGGDAAALKDRLGKLEEAIKTQREQEEAAKARADKDKESASSAPVAASSPPAAAYRPPPPLPTLAPTGSSSARAMTASCRPEPGPMYQIRQGNNTTVGRASTASLTGLATVDSGNSGNAPSPSTTPPPGGTAAGAAAPAAPTVHVVVHNPYGGPPGPYDPSRPDSPTGGDSVPLGWNWSRRATTDAVVAAAEMLLERRSRKKLDVPPLQPEEEDEDEEDGAVTAVPYVGPGGPRSGGGRGTGATAVPAAEASSSQQAAVGVGSSGGAGTGAESAAQVGPGAAKPVQVVGGSSAGNGEDLLLPLTPVAAASAAGTSSGAAADGSQARHIAAEGAALPPQLRFQLGPPAKRVSPPQAPWQQQPPPDEDGPGLQPAAHPDAPPLQGDGSDSLPRPSAGGGGPNLHQPTARRSMSRLSNASFNYSAWGEASVQPPSPPQEAQQSSPGRLDQGHEGSMPVPLLPLPAAASGGLLVPAHGSPQPIVMSPHDSADQQALLQTQPHGQQHGQQQQQQQQPIYITQHLVDGRTVVYAQGAAGSTDASQAQLQHPQPQYPPMHQQQAPQALTYPEAQQQQQQQQQQLQQQQQQQQRPGGARVSGRHRVTFASEAQAPMALQQPPQQQQPGMFYGMPAAQTAPGVAGVPGVAAVPPPAGVSPLPAGWVSLPAGAPQSLAPAAAPDAAAGGWPGAAPPGTAITVLYPHTNAAGAPGLAQGMLVLQASPAPAPVQPQQAAVSLQQGGAAAGGAAAGGGGSGGGALAPVAPDMSDMDTLLGELEARSRAAMTSPRRQGAGRAGGSGGGAGRAAYGGGGARAATAGGAMAGGSGTAAGMLGGGLGGLGAIDSLHVRATTLSAPGAPVFGSWAGPGGMPAAEGQAAGGRRATHASEVEDAGGSAAEGDRPSVVDAALRRLEAASVHAHAAAAAWTAVARQVEDEAVESGEREMSRLAVAVQAAAAAATAAATSSAAAAERTARSPARTGAGPGAAREPVAAAAAAAAASNARLGSGRAQPRRAPGLGAAAGGGAADLLATFLPGAQQAMRRQAPAAPAAYRAQQHQQHQQQQQYAAAAPYDGQDEEELAFGSVISQPYRYARRPESRWLADAGAAVADRAEQQQHQQRAAWEWAARQDAASHQHAAAQTAAHPHRSRPQVEPSLRTGVQGSYEQQQLLQHQRMERRQPSGGSASSETAAAAAEACPTCGSPTRPSMHARQVEPATRGAHALAHAPAQAPVQSGREERRVRWSLDGEWPAAPRERHRHSGAAGGLDPMAELAMLARRRGNAHLAATLAGLSGGAASGATTAGGDREPGLHAPAHAAAAPPSAAAAHPQRSVPGAASAARSDALRPAAPRGRDLPPSGSAAGPPAYDRACTRAPASAPPTPPRFGGGGMAAFEGGGGGGAAAMPAFPGALAAYLPRRPSTQDSMSSSASSGASSVGAGGGGGGPTLPALIDVDGSRLGAFDPDPLGSPLKGVLGECRRLQAAAVRREAEGHAVVREVVSELSPRSAVAAALRAVMDGRQGCAAADGGQGGAAGAGEGVGSRARRAILTSSRRV